MATAARGRGPAASLRAAAASSGIQKKRRGTVVAPKLAMLFGGGQAAMARWKLSALDTPAQQQGASSSAGMAVSTSSTRAGAAAAISAGSGVAVTAGGRCSSICNANTAAQERRGSANDEFSFQRAEAA